MADDRDVESHADFSFPVGHEHNQDGSEKARVVGHRDVVDTNWDIPVIDFSHDADAKTKPRIAGSEARAGSDVDREVASRTNFSTVNLRDAVVQNDHLLDPWDAMDDQTSKSDDEFDEVIAGAVEASEERSDDDSNMPQRHATHHTVSHRVWVIIVTCLVLLGIAIVVATGTLRWHHEHELRMQSSEACSTAVARYSAADKTLRSTLTEIAPQRRITAQQVGDGATVTRLEGAVKEAQALKLTSGQVQCGESLSVAENKANTSAANTASRKIEVSVRDLRTLASAVTASSQQYRAERSSAMNALTNAVTQAQEILSTSRYQVTDNTTRIDLESAIGTAKQELAQPDSTLDDIRKAEANVRNAQDAVTASMQAFSTQQQSAAQSYQQTVQQPTQQQAPSTNVQQNPTQKQAPAGSSTGGNSSTGAKQ